jgi:3-hydroxyacyl-[acyl-carrier-protein] dehydratase
MPPQLLFDPSTLDLNNVMLDQEGIGKINPQSFEFAMLDGVYLMDYESGNMAGYRDVRDDEFWVRGHIPGRPLFPGCLMIETAAQLVSYFAMSQEPERGFLGFGGVDNVKFRGSVVPGQRILMLGKILERRTRRWIGATQALVDGKFVYEGTITGVWL